MLCKIAITFVVVAAIIAVECRVVKPSYHQPQAEAQVQAQTHDEIDRHFQDDHHQDYYGHPKYKFDYGVEDYKTGDYKHHKEERDGDVVKGEYVIADPDGSIRTVVYTVDKEHGFQAHVSRHQGDKKHH